MSILILGVIIFALIYFLVKEVISYFGKKRMLKIMKDYDDMQKPANFYRKIVESIARDNKPIPCRLFTTESQKNMVNELFDDGYLKFVINENGEECYDITDKILV